VVSIPLELKFWYPKFLEFEFSPSLILYISLLILHPFLISLSLRSSLKINKIIKREREGGMERASEGENLI
jgi:hypothetical protein